MDLETERRLAAMIVEEASRLRREADRVGVAAYLAKPKTRNRANPQFLQATVRGIQQSNRIVESNDMWRRRTVELENEKSQRRHSGRKDRSRWHADRLGDSSDPHCGRRRDPGSSDSEGEGLKDEEMQQFLNSRLKRGRGAVGSRMDEPGPYLPIHDGDAERAVTRSERFKNEWEDRIVGPQVRPSAPFASRGDDADGEKWKHNRAPHSVERKVSRESGNEPQTTSKTDRKKEKKKHKKGRDSKRKKDKVQESSKRKRS